MNRSEVLLHFEMGGAFSESNSIGDENEVAGPG
jgi:hypothetical protein